MASTDKTPLGCPDNNPCCDGTDLLHGDWCKGECRGAHETGEMLWPGTAHQGVVCRRCKRFLPC